MDRNSAIGLTLIALLLMVYFLWLSPKPQPPVQQPVAKDTAATAPSLQLNPGAIVQPDSSLLATTYGDLSTYAKGEESLTTIETNDVTISFSSQGGIIKELELKKYKTYQGKPLKLIEPSSTSLGLLSTYKGQSIDLYKLFYKLEQRKDGDTTIVSFSLALSDGTTLSHVYKIPATGYEIGYSIISKGFENNLTGDQLQFTWSSILRPMEKDIKDTRTNSTITYYTEDYDELSPASNEERETLTQPIKWVSIKEKFFLSSIIASQSFKDGSFEIKGNEEDTSIVKRADVKLSIPKAYLAQGKAVFKYYFGPNDYQIIGNVAPDFAKNVYLGWPPVYWVNKFVIFPVFHFLTLHIGNFGIIIIILVLMLKLVLAPLSYKSYLSMAKMKVLKPELDEIKAKNGDDMAKTQQDQMKLYQQVGVNPISGCIPVLMQMPLIFAMFYLFPASIELRQQPFLWAEDLSTYDSIINLPFIIPYLGSHISLFTLLMTVSTLIYTWQNNQLSSVQGPMKSMSYIMPLIFFFVLNRFSSGLTFYYLVGNLVTFSQQAIIKRFVDEDKIKRLLEENRKKNLSGTGKKSKFMTKLEEAMKVSQEARKTSEDTKKKKKK